MAWTPAYPKVHGYTRVSIHYVPQVGIILVASAPFSTGVGGVRFKAARLRNLRANAWLAGIYKNLPTSSAHTQLYGQKPCT